MNKKNEILEEFAKQLDYWVSAAVKSSSDADTDLSWSEHEESFRVLQSLVADGSLSKDAVKSIMEEILRGFAVSILTVIDGGTSLASRVELQLKEKEGETFGELHDEFVMHLINTGRLE